MSRHQEQSSTDCNQVLMGGEDQSLVKELGPGAKLPRYTLSKTGTGEEAERWLEGREQAMSFSKEIKADRVYYALFVDALSVPVQPDSSQNSEFQKESVLMFPSRNLCLGRAYPCLGCSNRATGCRLPARPLCVCT